MHVGLVQLAECNFWREARRNYIKDSWHCPSVAVLIAGSRDDMYRIHSISNFLEPWIWGFAKLEWISIAIASTRTGTYHDFPRNECGGNYFWVLRVFHESEC